MEKRKCSILIFILLISIVCLACSKTSDMGVNTYIWGTKEEPSSLNPNALDEPYAFAINQNIFNRLVKVSNNYDILPDLAESWEYKNDNLSLVFYLRKNVKWHDGAQFSSEDVKFTFDIIMKNNGLMADSFVNVKEIKCLDKNTVEFVLSKSDRSILGSLSWYATFIMPKHLYEGTDWLTNIYNFKPIGTGPFKFKEWENGSSIKLIQNVDYFGDKPLLDQVIYKFIPYENTAYTAWLNNEIDQYDDYPLSEISKFESDEKYYFVDQLNPNITYIAFNLEDSQLSDVKLRQAIARAINRDEILEKAAKGIGKKGEYFLPSIYGSYLNDSAGVPQKNIESAIETLEEMGYLRGSDGYYLSIDLEYTDIGIFKDVAQIVQANLREIGVNVVLKPLDFAIWEETVFSTKNFSMTLLSGFQGPDIFGTTKRFYNSNINISGYDNSTVGELISEALSSSSEENIEECFKKIQQHLAEDIPNLPLLESVDHKPYKSYIKGHPAKDAIGKSGFDELTYVTLDK